MTETELAAWATHNGIGYEWGILLAHGNRMAAELGTEVDLDSFKKILEYLIEEVPLPPPAD